MKFKNILIILVLILLTVFVVDSQECFEKYQELEIKNVLSIKRSDLPDELVIKLLKL